MQGDPVTRRNTLLFGKKFQRSIRITSITVETDIGDGR
jgi:hypothetical protein